MTNQMTNLTLKSLNSELKVCKISENYSYETYVDPFLVTIGQYGPQVFKMPENRYK